MRRVVNRFVALYSQATEQERALGESWYVEARSVARAMAHDNSVSLATACGVIAALSPRLHWSRNVTVAEMCLSGIVPTGVFRANLDKATAIRDGARPLSVLSGPKVRAFYRALMGHDAPVIDVWMQRAAKVVGTLRDTAYELLADALITAAKELGIAIAVLQATIWIVVRGRHN
jgi:hypothetical protein